MSENNPNIIEIRDKPISNYISEIISQLSRKIDVPLLIRARGESIKSAVELVELIKLQLKDLVIEDISIGTERYEMRDHITISIALSRLPRTTRIINYFRDNLENNVRIKLIDTNFINRSLRQLGLNSYDAIMLSGNLKRSIKNDIKNIWKVEPTNHVVDILTNFIIFLYYQIINNYIKSHFTDVSEERGDFYVR